MAKQLQLRRGTTTEHATFTGAEAEVTVDTTKDTLVVHDGVLAGGYPLAKDSTVVHLSGAETITGVKTFSAQPVGITKASVGLGNVANTAQVTAVTGTAPIVSSGGTTPAISMAAATASVNGYMTSTYASKLDGIATGAQVNVATDLTVTAGTTSGPTINSSTGSDVVIPSASGTNSGIVTTGAQTFAGAKTLTSPVLVTPSIGVATGTSFNSITALADTLPLNNGTAAIGTSTKVARQDHVHALQSYTTGVQDWRDTAMSKAQFNALAAERRANRAGSGFDSFGANYFADNIQGIRALSTNVNSFFLGSDVLNSAGNIKTVINGVQHKIYDGVSSYKDQIVSLPSAPTIYQFGTTLTAEQIASGCITHVDASNSGLITNGKFDNTDTSGWTPYLGASLSIVSNKLRVTATTTDANPRATEAIPTVIGKKYVIEAEQYKGTNASTYIAVSNTSSGTSPYAILNSTVDGRVTLEFTATATTSYIGVFTVGSIIGNYSEFDNIAVFPSDAISRSDLVFLESWHEDVSEKDFVYPLGNVQYLGTTGDSGTPVAGAFAGFGTYSLFGNWQASGALVGKGYVWSTLSDANKKAFLANPENNCYLDGDKVIQVRYRMRVVQGWGDSWENNCDVSGITRLAYASGNARVKPKGKQVSILNDLNSFSGDRTAWYVSYDHTDAKADIQTQIGAFQSTLGSTLLDSVASYEGKCYAMPIALVHRRNQGGYHPVYNSNGTLMANDTTVDARRYWHHSNAFKPTSISDCFLTGVGSSLIGFHSHSGTIASTYQGRHDGLFYDQIHEGDIIDLRNSSQKVEDYNRLLSREFNKSVAGTTRGAEGERGVTYSLDTTVSSVSFFAGTTNGLGTYIVIPTPVSFLTVDTYQEIVNGVAKYFAVINGIPYYLTRRDNGTTLYIQKILGEKTSFTGSISAGNSVQILVVTKTTRTKSNTITHTDIIGSPANYPTAWKQSGVSGTPLIVAEGGTSLLPTGTTGSDGLAVYKLSRKANATPLQVLKSTNSGATWTLLISATHYTFSTTGNYIEFITGHRPLVADLIMVTYQTKTQMALPSVNSEVLAVGMVLGTNSLSRAHITSSLIGKIPVFSQDSSQYAHQVSNWVTSPVLSAANGVMLGGGNTGYNPLHNIVTLPSNTAPAAKVFPYLTRSNGKAYLNLVFKEMKFGSFVAPTVDTGASISHVQYATYQVSIAGCPLDGEIVQWTATTATAAINWALYNKNADGSLYVISSGAAYTNAKMFDGNSWGDDSKFNIVDNVSTTTDDNGATVLIGQKRIELPYFIGAGE
jgi:hypothetical protein